MAAKNLTNAKEHDRIKAGNASNRSFTPLMQQGESRINGDIQMKFTDINWADSNIVRISIEYNKATLFIWNEMLQQNFPLQCLHMEGFPLMDYCSLTPDLHADFKIKNAQ